MPNSVSEREKGKESCVYLTWSLFQCLKRGRRVVCTSRDTYFSVWKKGRWVVCTSRDAYFSVWKGPGELCVPHLMPISVSEKGHESCVYLSRCLFQCVKRAMRVVCTSLDAYFSVWKGPWELCVPHLMPISVCEKGHESCLYLAWCLFHFLKRAIRVVCTSLDACFSVWKCTSLDAYFSVWKGPWELCVPHLMPISVSEKGHESCVYLT